MPSQPKALKGLMLVSALLFFASLGMIFLYAPLEAVMNYVQKIFYFHIATAWVGMLGFMVASVAGIVYLAKKDLTWDVVGTAAVEISLVFFFIAIVSGSIWARPTWGTWWTWDARLTTAAILEMIYVAYLMLRQGIEDPERRARFGAIYTLVGGLSVPVTFLSIRLWQTIHPAIIGTQSAQAQGGFGMTPPMLHTMFFSLITFSVIFVTLLWFRIRLGRLASQLEALKQNRPE
ncbi:MAG: cytochrome c biogenesis protein CcsA [Anaerolineales bacterium]|nr:cytochrome c biogenesis protein CcsA [Anaerolineales bacterium]MCX7609930.1 cytochrome c biogenesis protein CcsA [Anaerolineales bacterium]MDW8227640.1 cytochrome c biogenesis protein CcsA [Anaerolineales bacterium]